MRIIEILDGYEDSDTLFDYLSKFDVTWETEHKRVKFKSWVKKPDDDLMPTIENGVVDFENGTLVITARNQGPFKLPFKAKNLKEFVCWAGITDWSDTLGAHRRIWLKDSIIIPSNLSDIPKVDIVQVSVPKNAKCNGSVSHWFDGHLVSASFGIDGKIAILRLEDWDSIRIDYAESDGGSWRTAIASDAFELQDWLIENGYESIA